MTYAQLIARQCEELQALGAGYTPVPNACPLSAVIDNTARMQAEFDRMENRHEQERQMKKVVDAIRESH